MCVLYILVCCHDVDVDLAFLLLFSCVIDAARTAILLQRQQSMR